MRRADGIVTIRVSFSRYAKLQLLCLENLSSIAEENAASTEETSASVSVVNELMGNVTDITNNIVSVAERLEGVIREFKV